MTFAEFITKEQLQRTRKMDQRIAEYGITKAKIQFGSTLETRSIEQWVNSKIQQTSQRLRSRSAYHRQSRTFSIGTCWRRKSSYIC